MAARQTRPAEETIVFGKRNARREWRQDGVTLSACLRSMHEYAYAYELDAQLSPSYGGPPV
jgi:hypothetical protein